MDSSIGLPLLLYYFAVPAILFHSDISSVTGKCMWEDLFTIVLLQLDDILSVIELSCIVSSTLMRKELSVITLGTELIPKMCSKRIKHYYDRSLAKIMASNKGATGDF